MDNLPGLVDFHCHHVPVGFEITSAATAAPSQRARWAETSRVMSDERQLLRAIEDGDLAARVVNAPAAMIANADGWVAPDTIRALNDAVAALAARHPGRIIGLATVDAYDGDRAARELERAIGGLGLKGAFVDCARGELLLDAPQARPVLEVAARMRVPVFAHPVNPQPLSGQLEPYGRLGTLLARGTANAAALVALVEGGVFSQLAELRVVVTALAFGGLALADGYSHFSRLTGGTREVLRRHVYIDTMGFQAAQIRASVEIVGADHVLIGSDWPIVSVGPIKQTAQQAMTAAGLTREQQKQVAGANALRLLGVDPACGPA